MPADSWLYNLIELWPILSSLTPVILLGGFYWLRTKFPSRQDFDALAGNVDQLDAVVARLKVETDHLIEERDAAPTRIQLMDEIGRLSARVSGVEAGVAAIGTQLATANDYLQILVERGLRP